MSRNIRPVIMLPVEAAELEAIRASAHRARQTVPVYLRKKLGLPMLVVKRLGRPPKKKMVQAPLFEEEAREIPPAPDSSKRASDHAIPVAEDKRDAG